MAEDRRIKNRHIDLRSGRRLTLVEGRLLLALLEGQEGRAAESARRKLEQACALSDHACRFVRESIMIGGRRHFAKRRLCSICGRGEDWRPRRLPAAEPETQAIVGRIGPREEEHNGT